MSADRVESTAHVPLGGGGHGQESGLAVAIVLFRRLAVPVVALVAAAALLVSTLGSSGSARYYPLFLIAIVAALALVELVTGRGAAAKDGAVAAPANVRELVGRNARGLAIAALVIGLWYAIPWLGFFASATLMLVLSCRVLGVGWGRGVVFAVVLLAVAYLVFVRLVAIALPTGYLF